MIDTNLGDLGASFSTIRYINYREQVSMSLILNILWPICGGFFVGLIYIAGGLLLCLSIIGIPFVPLVGSILNLCL